MKYKIKLLSITEIINELQLHCMKCLSVFFFFIWGPPAVFIETGLQIAMATSGQSLTLQPLKVIIKLWKKQRVCYLTSWKINTKTRAAFTIHALQRGQIRPANVAMSYNLYQQMKLTDELKSLSQKKKEERRDQNALESRLL